MTTGDPFDRRLADWLVGEAEHRVPDHLDSVLVRTVATRQRAWWSSPERWLPMNVLAPTRATDPRPIVGIFAVVVLLMTLVAMALVAAGMFRIGPLPVLADNGRIYVAEGGALSSYATDGGDPQPVVDLPAGAERLSFSPDGRSLAFIAADGVELGVVDVDDATVTTVDIPGMIGYGGPIAWSPDGERFLVNTFDGVEEHLYVATPDGSDLRDLGADRITPGQELVPVGWAPDGSTIAYVGVDKPATTGSMYLLDEDAGPPRPVGSQAVEPYSVSWSPDPSVSRLLYSDAAQRSMVRILDVKSGVETPVIGGRWPVWSPDGSRIALWTDGTQIVTTEAVLEGRPDPVYVFATPAHTQPGLAPLPGRFAGCDNPDQLSGTEICEPVQWSPDGTSVIGPDIGGAAVVVDSIDGSGTLVRIDRSGTGPVELAWRPVRE